MPVVNIHKQVYDDLIRMGINVTKFVNDAAEKELAKQKDVIRNE